MAESRKPLTAAEKARRSEYIRSTMTLDQRMDLAELEHAKTLLRKRIHRLTRALNSSFRTLEAQSTTSALVELEDVK